VFWGWVDGYLTGIIGVSVLGGQITFTVLVSDIADPAAANNAPTFHKETVRTFIGISWLLFTACLGISVLVKTVLSDPGERRWLVERLGARRFDLSVVPFLFLSLAVVAYLPVVGWIGAGFVAVLMLVVGIFWFVMDGTSRASTLT
jgi:hypothetical protein